MFKKLKKKLSDKWNKFKKFYQRNYKKRKALTITLTVIAAALSPFVLILLFYAVMFVVGLAITLVIFWIIYKLTIGSGKSSSSRVSSSRERATKSSGRVYHGVNVEYAEEDVLETMNAEPKLRGIMDSDWRDFAEALDESRYTKEVKVINIGSLPVFIFPRDKKPQMNIHFLRENTVESGGGLFERAKEHFNSHDLSIGEVCVIYNGKRLTNKDL